MTRVLHILDHSLPLHSGYTFRTRAILKSSQSAGIEVCGITGNRHLAQGPPVETVDGLTFHRTATRLSSPPIIREWQEIEALRAGIERVAKEWRPDIIHAHSPALCGMAGLRTARRLGMPFVYEIRAFWNRQRRLDKIPPDPRAGKSRGRKGRRRLHYLQRPS